MQTTTLPKFYGLDYVTIVGVPCKKSKQFGDTIAAAILQDIERKVATLIIQTGIPIRGIELKFLRKSLGLSLADFGSAIGLSAPAVLKWEREPEKRINPINEFAVRSVIAERLNLTMQLKFSDLMKERETPKSLRLKAV